VEAQLVELDFAFTLSERSVLFTVDMQCKTRGTCLFQLQQKFPAESQAIGIDNRFQSVPGNKAHNVHNIRMDQGISPRQGDTIRLPEFSEHLKFTFDFVDWLVAAGIVLPVTSFTVHVACFCDLKPGNGIVRQRPRETIVLIVIEKECHGFSLPFPSLPFSSFPKPPSSFERNLNKQI
jgi:hypothetical protein